MTIRNNFSWRIGGEAGDGILNAGLQMFAKTCLRSGLKVFATAEYPSLIRGGHNNLEVRVEERDVYAQTRFTNLLVAMNKDTIDKHKDRLSKDAGIIYDGEYTKVTQDEVPGIKLYDVPLFKIANENGGKIMRNTVALGATMALLDFDTEIFKQVIHDNFETKKGDAIVQANLKAAMAGYDYIKKNYNVNDFPYKLHPVRRSNTIFLSGNEAITTGLIRAGCKFYAAYPMTPASSILGNMAGQELNYNIVVKHTEDELAAINEAIGAAYAGARAATGTSGGGFALMSEGFGMAVQAEVPLVVIEAQRPGPGTGMATHSGQGDLRFMLHASTDEGPRVVIAPGDVDECFHLTVDAFNIAEKYQTPVIILTDKYLGESYTTVEEFNTNVKIERGKLLSDKEAEQQHDYKRYKMTSDFISPRAIPGQKNCMHVATSYEHDEEGHEREEEEIRVMMHNKRFKKHEAIAKEVPQPKLVGDNDAEVTIVSWGSTKGPIKEAMMLLKADGIKANYLQVVYLSPFPDKKVEEVMKHAKNVILVENNKTGQLGGVIKEHTGLTVGHKILKYDGRPFTPEDIQLAVKEILHNKELKEVVISKEKIVEAW